MTDHTMTRAEFEAMYQPHPPERIYNWLDTQLSIARHYGGCTYQGFRYVTDDEFARILAAASPKLATIARFIELTGMRQSDALQVRLSDIDDEGIHYAQGKTGKRLVVTWSDELRTVVADANRLWRRFGRRGGAADAGGRVRGALARELDLYLPSDAPGRLTTIAELLTAAGLPTTPATVRRLITRH